MTVLARLAVSCMVVLFLSGCTGQPVRHLASDASLITPGVSTRSDVLTYLGDPDERQEEAGEPERWIYLEEYLSTMQRTVGIGKWFGSGDFSRIIVTFDGEIVSDIRYNASETGEFE